MTDNEIVKALEVESTPSEVNCVHGNYIEACGIYCTKKNKNAEYCHDCEEHTMAYYGRRAKATLALINRQKAEIERLEKAIEVVDFMEELREKQLKRAKADAVKEFAERLHEKLSTIQTAYNARFGEMIDNLVKEFTEGGDDSGMA